MADENKFINAVIASLQRQITGLSGQLAQAEAKNSILAAELAELHKQSKDCETKQEEENGMD